MVLSISARNVILVGIPVCVYGEGEILDVAARVAPAPGAQGHSGGLQRLGGFTPGDGTASVNSADGAQVGAAGPGGDMTT